ncbi:MAG: hypothetical protein R3B92_02910 [Patescibacteria group bacterium]
MLLKRINLELFSLLILGLLAYAILFIRVGFLLGITINVLTLPVIVISYLIMVYLCVVLLNSYTKLNIDQSLAPYYFLSFLGFVIVMGFFTYGLGYTYDTSWDGQGYHQTAIIALRMGWNPILDSNINLLQELPSQIFAEGYPSAIWELQASIYAFTNKINSAKVINLVFGFVSFLLLYDFFSSIKIRWVFNTLLSFAVVFQPVYVLQLFTYMQDGLGYQLYVIAFVTLAKLAMNTSAYISIPVFALSQIFLVSSKYSNLPVALVLSIICGLLLGNRFLNKDYKMSLQLRYWLIAVAVIVGIFAFVPYGRNLLWHKAMFYPVNRPELLGAVEYNNVPSNLKGSNKLSLLFYGIFSRSQEVESGDPRSLYNIAILKWPFEFSWQEVLDGSSLFNNRVGAGGPLFSGIVFLSILFLLFCGFVTQNRNQRYAVYLGWFSIVLFCVLAVLTPNPNLLRYVSQLQLIPFVVIVPLITVFKKSYVNVFANLIAVLVLINVSLYAYGVVFHQHKVQKLINNQFSQMKESGKTYYVRAQQFYSNYALLSENNVAFYVADELRCGNVDTLVSAYTTTQFCSR